MKKILSLILMLAMAFSVKADLITATVTITNVPANGATITSAGDTRIWTNGVITVPAIWIAATNNNTVATNTLNASNLFYQVLSSPFNGIQTTWPSTTNIVRFFGQSPLTITVSSGYCSVVYTTNTTTDELTVAVPFSGYSSASQIRMASQLVTGIDGNSTNAFSAGSPALTNHVNTTAAQIVSGAKNFTGGISGTVVNLTNGGWIGASLTNSGATNFSVTNLTVSTSFTSSGPMTNTSTFTNVSDVNIGGDLKAAGGVRSGHRMSARPSTGDNSLDIWQPAISAGSPAMIRLLSSDGTTNFGGVDFNGNFLGNANLTNLTVAGNSTHGPGGTNTFTGQVAFTRYNNTGLANGYNADISLGTNVYVKLSGPSGAFTNVGFVAGVNGEYHIVQQSTGQSMVMIEESGLESTAANRILLGLNTGGTYTNTNNPGCFTIVYDSAASRWILVGKNN